jgi:integrase/recombinase XerD
MARLRSRKAKPKKAVPLPHNPLQAMLPPYLEWMQVRQYSENTVETRRNQLGVFLRWCDERGLENPHEITRPVLERYQRYLFHYRQRNSRPLSFRTQHGMLVPLRGWFRWMTRQNHILHNPASELELPRLGHHLPKHVLTVEEVELVLQQPNITDPMGLRDRAILETLYSTGIRRGELIQLKLYDTDVRGGTLFIRQGKGKKDRVVPIGERAIKWIEKYLREVRPELAVEPDDMTLFLSQYGEALSRDHLSGHGARLSAGREHRQGRRPALAPSHHGHVDAGERRRPALHPGNPRPRKNHDHANLHARFHPASEAGA